jgi:hypothetical protein
VNFIKVLLASAGNVLPAVVMPPQPGNMGNANIEAKPKPPRKIFRREGLLRALSRTSWKCWLLDWLSMGSNELDTVSSVAENLIVNSCCDVYVTNKVAEKN